jgi:GNAT superfamily N-acetyltransferase
VTDGNPDQADVTGALLRRALPAGSDVLASVWLRARAASVPAIPPPVHTEGEVRAWFRDVVLADREVWVADAGGQPVALLVLDREWVDQLYVEPTLTGRGLGSRLLELAKARRPAGLELWTFAANAGARRFYERNGFREAEQSSGNNEEGAPDVRYRWDGRGNGSARSRT